MLGATCPVLDINGACAGFIYALYTAQAYLKAGCKRILILCAETPVKMADWRDRATCVLFGDGAGAVVVTAEGEEAAILLKAKSDTKKLFAYNPPSNCPFTSSQPEAQPLYMDGQEVYKFAVSTAIQTIEALMERQGLSPKDITYFVLHQANKRIVEAVRHRMHQPLDKFPTNIEQRGNTSSASIPILLNEMNEEGRIKPGNTLMFSAFGAGLVAGTALLHWT